MDTWIKPDLPPVRVTIGAECAGDLPAREALLDSAFGPGRFRKSSEKLRRGRFPAEGLAFTARDGDRVVGTVRLWNIAAGTAGEALLLGPLATDPSLQGQGIGGRLMAYAISEAARLGHRAILLVGDAPYYNRFGFERRFAQGLSMPGPLEADRFLGLELVAGSLDGASGMLRPTGRHAAIAQRKAA
ncbi:GNAT family N-acetyltransferase [Tepidamorphus sp. 3E244]|uniref:GNAT family N-acetyltransferase n=1 Tax=Tepidamorphus sp. 3E244 TaxID=3385498 RepID=UPI0038FC702C